MGVFTYETEIVTTIPPAKMFMAFVLDGDKLIPKVVPQAVKSVEIIEGDGGPRSIKKITFGEGQSIITLVASSSMWSIIKVEAVDKDNFIYTYSLIEGDALMGTVEKITYETKIVASPDGESICKNTSKYYTVGEIEIEVEIKAGKEKALGLFKAVEAYLLANPDTY